MLTKILAKIRRKLHFSAQIVFYSQFRVTFCNLHLKITPYTKFQANRIKNKEVRIFYFFSRMEPKIQDDVIKTSYENELLDNMIRSGHRRLARSFNLCYRYIDDLIVFNNKKFLDYLKEIYPSQLTVEKANKSDHLADYLDLTFIIDSGGKLSTRLYDKRDDFDFHIVNFPFLSSNIPSGPSYGVYISQLIRYARCCSHYDDFRYRHKCLVDRLLSQGYRALRLEKSFKKFYGRYQDLIEKYQRSVNAMVSDSFPGQFLFNM